jgi:hypothetical protein
MKIGSKILVRNAKRRDSWVDQGVERNMALKFVVVRWARKEGDWTLLVLSRSQLQIVVHSRRNIRAS